MYFNISPNLSRVQVQCFSTLPITCYTLVKQPGTCFDNSSDDNVSREAVAGLYFDTTVGRASSKVDIREIHKLCGWQRVRET